MHNVSCPYSGDMDVGFLCLLCQRTLSNEESYSHVFSKEHVTSFLVSIFFCFFLAFFPLNDCNMLTVASGLQFFGK